MLFFFKYIGILIITIINFINNFQHKNNFKRVIFILLFIIILHLIIDYIEIYTYLEKNVNNDSKSSFIKFYLSYPILFLYAVIELYSIRNYYFFKIRYVNVISLYLIISSFYMIKYDKTLKMHMGAKEPDTILLMRRIYFMIFLLLIFIKTLERKKNEIKKIIPNVIFNSKLFFIVLINFICMD